MPASIPYDEPFTIKQETDTAIPCQPIPIYLMHSGQVPFCANPSCFCQRGKRAGARLYQDIAAGQLHVAQYIGGIPADCSLYGHDWQQTERPDVKECGLCHVRGYCPHCSPVAPAGAQPFACTFHAGRK